MIINLRRGLFRLWIIFACLFVIAVGIASTQGIRDEFRKDSITNKWGWALMVPVDCSEARGKVSTDYSKEKDGLCWYEMSKFRAQYTEYKDLKDDQLSDRLYEKAGLPANADSALDESGAGGRNCARNTGCRAHPRLVLDVGSFRFSSQ